MIHNSPIFIDTNVLVYANLALSPFHLAATTHLQALWEQNIELWVSRQILREYLAAMTRATALTTPLPIAALVRDVERFAADFAVADDTAAVSRELLVLLTEVPAGGAQVHDANIVATMLAYGVRRLLTHNVTHFSRYSNYIEMVPLLP